MSNRIERRRVGAWIALGAGVLGTAGVLVGQVPNLPPREGDEKGLAERFRGVTTNGRVEPDLFEVRSSGVSTEPVRRAALDFRSSLSPEQRTASSFAVDDDEWRRWMNQHYYVRRGISFGQMTRRQRESAIGLLRASLSAKGLRQTRDIMRLNATLGELTRNSGEYSEGHYHFTMMGEPSASEPWGWQLDGHHLIINFFVLGDQVVMTPTFMGSEPRSAVGGVHAGTTVLVGEEGKGLAMINALNPRQRSRAILATPKGRANNLAKAWKDNLVVDYAGIRAGLVTVLRRSLISLCHLCFERQRADATQI